jgi:cellulose synthase/poly-beta-1,6-N-acetylglucosamine synthase-like glycosyltransferase
MLVSAMFWISAGLIVYPYLIYPALLVLLNRLTGRRLPSAPASRLPSVSIVLPVHNEARLIAPKIANLLALDYPPDAMQIIVVGDGCTDDSLERAAAAGAGRVVTTNVTPRSGKAAALNAGLAHARNEIVVFTDAAIMLEPQSLKYLVPHFAHPSIGCVSGEDYVQGESAEGVYGKLELLLRREEARLHSIAGASGCFYAERRELCKPFQAGMAPDFLSVLNVVRAGYRAVAEPAARGAMSAARDQRAEFTRKSRTFLRGVTALMANASLLNPFKYPAFSFILLSHKLLRWLAPLAMIACLVSAALLASRPFYALALAAQLALYVVGIVSIRYPALAERNKIARLSAFFLLVNLAALQALWRWLAGERLEVWQPTRRPT